MVGILLICEGFPNPMLEPLKSLAAGTSSTLYAALDPSLKGMSINLEQRFVDVRLMKI